MENNNKINKLNKIYMKKAKLLFVAIAMIACYSVSGQVAITTDGSSADGSAMLDIKSTDKGFLPPRMLEAQRDGISSPVAGLVVWCTNCGSSGELQVYNGSDWTNMIGGDAAPPPAIIIIGDSYQGGILAYIFQSGDPGYVEGETHGLIAAASDQSTDAEWGCSGRTISGADGTALGTGAQNTTDILTDCTEADIAAKLCADYSNEGYDDWYLPSKDELNKLYLNQTAVGAFVSAEYWSSSEYSYRTAWEQYFGNGYQYNYNKDDAYRVRAVRAF